MIKDVNGNKGETVVGTVIERRACKEASMRSPDLVETTTKMCQLKGQMRSQCDLTECLARHPTLTMKPAIKVPA